MFFSFDRVAKPSQVYFGGTVVGEQAMKSEDEVGSLIEYEFRVSRSHRPEMQSWYVVFIRDQSQAS